MERIDHIAIRGLSPRVRGNHDGADRSHRNSGSIPACAGEPSSSNPPTKSARVYPRVCGGTVILYPSDPPLEGLSPRVRGNLQVAAVLNGRNGSIPACAGEPSADGRQHSVRGVYPRVCGGTVGPRAACLSPQGLSPRVRGNPRRWPPAAVQSGSIPACAGEPISFSPLGAAPGVYPRVCGGTKAGMALDRAAQGLSPRVRGNLGSGLLLLWGTGSIPACAGEPARGWLLLEPIGVYPRVCGGTSCY